MGKSNRATRKELETIIQEIIKELQILRQGFTAIDNYLGAYVKFKGDSITFNDFLTTEIEKMEKDRKATIKKPENKDVKSAKKSRYSKVSTPPL
tara:strand:+ start:129 stop:410 length:282 start_codon:yes stop_codon:yes gene_type:complete